MVVLLKGLMEVAWVFSPKSQTKLAVKKVDTERWIDVSWVCVKQTPGDSAICCAVWECVHVRESLNRTTFSWQICINNMSWQKTQEGSRKESLQLFMLHSVTRSPGWHWQCIEKKQKDKQRQFNTQHSTLAFYWGGFRSCLWFAIESQMSCSLTQANIKQRFFLLLWCEFIKRWCYPISVSAGLQQCCLHATRFKYMQMKQKQTWHSRQAGRNQTTHRLTVTPKEAAVLCYFLPVPRFHTCSQHMTNPTERHHAHQQWIHMHWK